MSKEYWDKIFVTAKLLRNRFPTRATSLDKLPHQVWTSKKPRIPNLIVFGCHAYVTVLKQKRTKFDDH